MLSALTTARCLRAVLGCAVVAIALTGCSSTGSSFTYNEPPTVNRGVQPAAGGATIVVGSFANPSRPSVRLSNVGPGMSDALVRTLMNRGEYEVRLDARLAREARSIIGGSPDKRGDRLDTLRRRHPDVRYVVTGTVTDFHHSTDVPAEASRRGLFGRKREAVVAVQLNVIDLATGKVVATDHVHGTAGAPRKTSRKQYDGVSFGSYVFWTTPLGKASEKALGKVVQVLDRIDPADTGEIVIVRQIGPRRVILNSGTDLEHVAGREYFVCQRDEATGRMEPVLDRDTERPIRAWLAASGSSPPTALLVGLKPPDVSLRGAVLMSALPAAPAADAAPPAEDPAATARTAAVQ